MTKLEYGDYYRFVVSVGVASVVLSLLFPWLVLREPFDFLVSSDDLGGLTDLAREVVLRRQDLTNKLVLAMPWISGVLLLVGAVLIVAGLVTWRRRQKALDEEQNLRTQKLKKELQVMSQEDVDRKTELEVASLAEFGVLESPDPSVVSDYRKVETEIAKGFSRCLGERRGHTVLPDRRIGPAQYDLVVQHRSGNGIDLVVEIKLVRKNFHYGWITEVARKVAVSAQIYGGLLLPSARALLIIVVPSPLLRAERLNGYIRRLAEDPDLAEPNLRVRFVDLDSLADLNCRTVEGWVEGLLEGPST